MGLLVVLTCLIAAGVPAGTRPAVAQRSRCADCHFSRPDAPARDHLSNWDRSAHGRQQVGCETCHGGAATTFDSLVAHRGVLNSGNPSSPVNPRNLPATCGRCHTSEFQAFRRSRHFDLLQQGDLHVPVCSTCHGAAGYRRPSPRALESTCAGCHAPTGSGPSSEYAAAARTLYQALNTSREALRGARRLIDRVDDQPRRTALDEAYQQADVALVQAAQAGHQFVYDALRERLQVARGRIDALLNRLVQ